MSPGGAGHDDGGGGHVRLAGSLRPLPSVLPAVIWDLVAALQVGAPGGHRPLTPQWVMSEVTAVAEDEVKSQVSPL